VRDVPITTAASLPEDVDTVADVNNALEIFDAIAPTPDSSFDISLISDTSTTSEDQDADDESESDTSFTLPPPPATPIGLGISGLVKPDGSPFDGMGVVSFGCDAAGHGGAPRAHRRETGGLSRAFLEEVAWTWAADPHHLMLTVIDEGDEEREEEPQVWENAEQERIISKQEGSANRKSKTSGARTRIRDLSAVDTISSGLKRQNRRSSRDPAATVPAPRSPSVAPGAKRTAAQPAWRV
jgi:hypothetical protein